MKTIQEGTLESFQAALAAGIDVQAVNSVRWDKYAFSFSFFHMLCAEIQDEMTVLMLAAKNGHRDIVQALMAAGSNVLATVSKYNYIDSRYEMKTALMFAAENGHEDIVHLLATECKGLAAFTDKCASGNVSYV